MALTLAFGLILSLFASQAIAWTYTRYFSPTMDVLGRQSVEVFPTGSVSVTSSETVTQEEWARLSTQDVTLDVTGTLYWLASGSAPVCVPGDSCAGSFTSSNDVETTVFAPVVVTNPASCTQTSYSYTSSSSGRLEQLLNDLPGAALAQATETGADGPALAVSTYVVTLSTNLGGQAVTTKRCDIFLKPDQVKGLTIDPVDRSLMAECVDPRRYLCPTALTAAWTSVRPSNCGTDWVGAYGQGNPTAPAGGAAATGASGGGQAEPKPNGAWGRREMVSRCVVLGAGLLVLRLMVHW